MPLRSLVEARVEFLGKPYDVIASETGWERLISVDDVTSDSPGSGAAR